MPRGLRFDFTANRCRLNLRTLRAADGARLSRGAAVRAAPRRPRLARDLGIILTRSSSRRKPLRRDLRLGAPVRGERIPRLLDVELREVADERDDVPGPTHEVHLVIAPTQVRLLPQAVLVNDRLEVVARERLPVK